jgi:hypothetical protein
MTCPACQDQKFRVVAIVNNFHIANGRPTVTQGWPVVVSCSECAETKPPHPSSVKPKPLLNWGNQS